MAILRMEHCTFTYDGSAETLFDDLTLQIDTDWKTGLIARNGRGKTTLLKLLMKELECRGTISAPVRMDLFPYSLKGEERLTLELLNEVCPLAEDWQLMRELSLLETSAEILYRPFETLSQGEKTKAQLAALFSQNTAYLLIDEPTNHLDMAARQVLARYLQRKKEGFLLVSHDRAFLDQCIDHVVALNRSQVEVQQGNFSSWKKNRDARNQFEQNENEKLTKEIARLSESARRQAVFSDRVEATKFHNGPVDRGFIGAQAARAMKKAKNTEKRINRKIEQKEQLLHDLEFAPDLKVNTLSHHSPFLIRAEGVSVVYGDRVVAGPLDLVVKEKDRLAILGANGSGKSSLLRCLLKQADNYRGTITQASDLKVSYVSQDTSFLQGSLIAFAQSRQLDETLFLTLLRKLDFRRELFERAMESYSEGQKKKVLIAASLAQPAHLLVWDEPLNFIDLDSRMQIESLILRCQPTMIVIEHDQMFVEKTATKRLWL